jgi:hypothetical protein
VAVLGSTTASQASAAEFKCEVNNCALTGFQEAFVQEKISIGTGLSVTCSEAMTASYSASAWAPELTVTPTASNCTSSVGSASIKFNHCDYNFPAATTGEHARLKVTCSGGSQIELTTGGCTIKLGEQTAPKYGLRYINKEEFGFDTVTVQITAGELAYSKTGLTCGFVSGEATYTGAELVKCYEEGKRYNVINDKFEVQTTTYIYSHALAQVNCEWRA